MVKAKWSGHDGADAGGTAGVDATSSGHADSGVDASTGPAPTADGGTALDAAAVDAAPAILTCNGLTCAAAEFCATLLGANPDAGGADAAAVDEGGAAEGDAAVAEGGAGGGMEAEPLLSCQSAVFANICDNPTGTLYFDPYDPDNAAAVSLGASLASACRMTIASPDAGPADPDSGEPLTGIGNLCILAGGAYGHPVTGYLDNNSITDVILRGANDDAGVYDLLFTQEQGPGAPRDLVVAPFTEPPNIDYFLVELAVDPGSGSLCLDVLRHEWPGHDRRRLLRCQSVLWHERVSSERQILVRLLLGGRG